MNWKKLGLAFFTLDFLALSAFALFGEPVSALVETVSGNFWGIQIFADLCIALTFGTVWMWRDAKRLGINPLPYALAVPLTGSIALLVYALRRPSAAHAEEGARSGLAAARA